jgi:hypothetical protein
MDAWILTLLVWTTAATATTVYILSQRINRLYDIVEKLLDGNNEVLTALNVMLQNQRLKHELDE